MILTRMAARHCGNSIGYEPGKGLGVFRISWLMTFSLLVSLAMAATASAARTDLTDKDISMAVDKELMLSQQVASHLVDVETEEGVVTLTGSVDSLFAKEMATRIAESVKGVVAVVNRIMVRPVSRTDREIENDVTEALVLDPAADSYELEVAVENGVVTLSGTVESWTEEKLSMDVAKSVLGVREVKDDIVMKYDPNRPDQEIEAEVAQRLKRDPFVNDQMIVVNVKDHVVTLSGSVGSAADKRQAKSDAWVAGVKEVKGDDLKVEWWLRDDMKRRKFTARTDTEVKEAIEKALVYDPRTLSFKIDVDVNDGVAVLEGRVDNLKARRAAEMDARNTIGVWNVLNFIKVRNEEIPSDRDIAERIRQAFTRDYLLNRFDFAVSVFNQKAYLYGTVDTELEKERAHDVASKVFGVAAVANNIRVDDTWIWKSDYAIKNDVEDEFFWSPFVDGEDISVNVTEGMVTLTGRVDSMQELDSAVKNAFDAGARSVRSELAVKNAGNISRFYRTPLYYTIN